MSEKFSKLVRQGDVLLCKLAKATRRPRRKATRVVLAEGEVTGHNHTIEAVPLEIDGVMWIVAPEAAPVKHQEHAPARLDPGQWLVAAQAEPDIFAGMQRVLD